VPRNEPRYLRRNALVVAGNVGGLEEVGAVRAAAAGDDPSVAEEAYAVLAEYRAADAILLPSIPTPHWEENQACVAQEAMLMKLPVLSTRTGGVQESIAPELRLLAVDPGDANALADRIEMLLDLELRASGLGRLASSVILATLFLLVLDVWLDEPAYNFFPTALAVGATALGVLVLTAPLAIFGLLVLGLLVPVGSFTFQVHRNRSVEAATRHFGFVALGGCLGIAALALAASLPHEQPANTFVLLVVVLVVAFALLLAAIPFHTHAALLAGEVPPAALAL